MTWTMLFSSTDAPDAPVCDWCETVECDEPSCHISDELGRKVHIEFLEPDDDAAVRLCKKYGYKYDFDYM